MILKRFLGDIGENAAVRYLKRQGYKIIERNFSCRFGEIDIIAKDKDYLVFVEVKARMSRAFGDPAEAVDLKKQQKIRDVAQLYLIKTGKTEKNCRFDVVALLGGEQPFINHVIDAF